jgi:hypothetical protein
VNAEFGCRAAGRGRRFKTNPLWAPSISAPTDSNVRVGRNASKWIGWNTIDALSLHLGGRRLTLSAAEEILENQVETLRYILDVAREIGSAVAFFLTRKRGQQARGKCPE